MCAINYTPYYLHNKHEIGMLNNGAANCCCVRELGNVFIALVMDYGLNTILKYRDVLCTVYSLALNMNSF